MKVKIRTPDNVVKLVEVSKAMLVQEFRKKVAEVTSIEAKKQRLLFRGKQLENGCDLLDYKINVGDVIDVSERVVLQEVEKSANKGKKKEPEKFENEREPDENPSTSNSAAQAVEDKEKLVESLKEICPDLAAEIQNEEKVEPCKKCKDNAGKKCKECGCSVCGEKDEEDKQLFCEQCQYTTHMWCLDPPLDVIPEDDWYCPDCKIDASEIVQAGERGNKFSARTNKMPSRVNTGNKRDWGKGLATAGRTKTCTSVAKNHFGAIPGIDVGMCWKYRIQVSEEGIHRPPVGGISGRAEEGCQSIVLAGGYEDDVDNGDEFIYTGSGGRDLSGNKRTAEQSCDQILEKYNLAIARNCDAPIDKVNGNEGKNWKKGKPIRVIRSSKMAKHFPKYAPADGNRYDGLYKVVKYWPENGRAGFKVWRYLLRRDDPAPAPWEEGAKKFECIVPDLMKGDEAEDANPAKKIKTENFKLDKETLELVKADDKNASAWKSCLEFEGDKKAWYDNIEVAFGCVICQDILDKPVTLPCSHNVCLGCLERSFKAEIYNCPMCRHELGKEFEKAVNQPCEAVIVKLFGKK